MRYEATLQALSEIVRDEYFDAALGSGVAGELSEWRFSERYEALDPDAFASAVTADLQALSRDRHLKLSYLPAARVAPPPPSNLPFRLPPDEPPPAMLPFLTANRFGVGATEILPGNIGRIELTGFPPPFRETRRRIDEAFTAVADTWGLVIDLTRNGGGTPPTVAYALSYLFDRPPFAIGGFRWRHRPEERSLTTLDLGGPRYGEGRPLVVAISSSTFSGGEECAYALKAMKRAVIVGEISAGAANPGARYPLPGGFVGFVPQGQAVHPLTGTSWEGVGVVPDVSSAPEVVQQMALRTVLEAVLVASDESRRRAVQDALKTLSA